MSRIDEALKRAERQESEESPCGGPVLEPPIDVGSSLDRYQTERQTVRAVTRERLHAVVPAARSDDHAGGTPPEVHIRGKASETPRLEPVAIEQYRRLAALLEKLQAERGVKCVMVSSACPREGKTLTVTNIAMTLSESYARRVLVIDADLRRPSVHTRFKLPNDAGLIDLLRSHDADVAVVPVSQTLSVLTAGTADSSPLSMLNSDRLRTVVETTAARFDWVFIDTPPVGVLTDAQLVAQVADGVLFVIAAGITPYTLVQRTIAELGPTRIIGTVLNRVDRRTLTMRGYYDRYYTDPQHTPLKP